MFKSAWWFGLAMAMAGAAQAADKPVYGPPPAWVRPAALPAAPATHDSAPLHLLLTDIQTRVTPGGEDAYGETVIQVTAPQGLQALGNLAFPWDPSTMTLVIHKMQIIREGRVIDLMADGRNVTVLRRENNLERAMLDGWLTAALQPAGLQVGDLIDIAMTFEHDDPLLKGHTEFSVGASRDTPVGRLRVRVLWPKGRKIYWKEIPGLPSPRLIQTPEGQELDVDASDLPALQSPKDAPVRFRRTSQIRFSDFANWGEASALMAPLYAKAETLSPNSPLKLEIAKIKAASADPKVQAAMALHLVQDQVRYLYLGMNLGGYLPADADVTWERRFGDCKGKTVLLLALLHGLGIEATPAFVSSEAGDGLDELLPALLFDHAIVRATVAGQVYWLDGTRLGDRALDDIQVPSFKWALAIRQQSGILERLVQPPLAKPDLETIVRLDASAGLDVPAPAQAQLVMRGEFAGRMKLAMEALQPAQRDSYLREYWKKTFDFIEAKSVDSAYDAGVGEERFTLDGAAKMEWRVFAGGVSREYEADQTLLGWRADYSRPAGPGADAPFVLNFPSFAQVTETIILPDGGRGFRIVGSDIDRTLAATELKRRSRLQGDQFTAVASTRTLASEVSAAQARADQEELRKLAQSALFVQAPGGPAIVTITPSSGAPSRTDVSKLENLLNEGYTFTIRGNLDAALDEYNRAAKLAPTITAIYINRGGIFLDKGDLDAAQADFEKALTLSPNIGMAVVGRGRVLYARHRYADALAVYDQALRQDPDIVTGLISRAMTYRALNRPNDAKADLDRALDIDPRSVWALNNRAILEMALGQVDAASADAEKAIATDANIPGDAYRVRAWVFAERGKLEDAVKALDVAIQRNPKDADSLRLRGVVKKELGRFPDALSDFDSSLAVVKGLGLPEPTSARKGRGMVLSAMGRYPEAVQDFGKALAGLPNDVQSLIARADAYHREGEDDLALADLKTVVRLRPNESSSYIAMASFHRLRGNYTGALEALEQAHRLAPGDVNIMTTRAEVLGRAGRYEEGLRVLDGLIAVSPNDAQLLNNRCWYRAILGRQLTDAVADCTASLSLKPDMAAVFDSRGLAELRLARFDDAIRDYDSALKLRPTQAESLYGRGIAKLRSGRNAEGQADLAAGHSADDKVDEEFAGFGVKP